MAENIHTSDRRDREDILAYKPQMARRRQITA
jgi:hypothetical protein